VAEQVEVQIKYQGYIARQQQDILRRGDLDSILLPTNMDYAQVKGLSKEVEDKLTRYRPETLGQASRISGITPAAITLLMVHIKRGTSSTKKLKTS